MTRRENVGIIVVITTAIAMLVSMSVTMHSIERRESDRECFEKDAVCVHRCIPDDVRVFYFWTIENQECWWEKV